jgi:integrase
MVWTLTQLGAFLDAAEEDRLYALFHVIAFRGLRRGEAVGLNWSDIDLDSGLLTVSSELVLDGWKPHESDVKTEESAATIGLDSGCVAALRAHRARQIAERLEWGEAWHNTGKVFTASNGKWLHPGLVSDTFIRIREAAELPPTNLRDLRHGAATVMHAGGGDLHYIKETLRHSTTTLTSNTYTSLLPEVDKAVAEAAAKLVPRQASGTSGHTPGTHGAGSKSANSKAPRPGKPGRDAKAQVRSASETAASDQIESRLSDSNRRPSVYKTDALTS